VRPKADLRPRGEKKRRPSVGLLARGSRLDEFQSSRPPPSSPSPTNRNHRRVGLRERTPLTVAGPRRLLTGFPVMPVGTEGTYSIFRNCCMPYPTTATTCQAGLPGSWRAAKKLVTRAVLDHPYRIRRI